MMWVGNFVSHSFYSKDGKVTLNDVGGQSPPNVR